MANPLSSPAAMDSYVSGIKREGEDNKDGDQSLQHVSGIKREKSEQEQGQGGGGDQSLQQHVVSGIKRESEEVDKGGDQSLPQSGDSPSKKQRFFYREPPPPLTWEQLPENRRQLDEVSCDTNAHQYSSSIMIPVGKTHNPLDVHKPHISQAI